MSANEILLYFTANIERYEVTVEDDCGGVRKRVLTRQSCLCFCTRSPCVRIIARPLISGYSTLLYFWINPTCQKVFSLYFNFPMSSPAPQPTANTFTLTDGTYGLPIDGVLSFTSS